MVPLEHHAPKNKKILRIIFQANYKCTLHNLLKSDQKLFTDHLNVSSIRNSSVDFEENTNIKYDRTFLISNLALF